MQFYKNSSHLPIFVQESQKVILKKRQIIKLKLLIFKTFDNDYIFTCRSGFPQTKCGTRKKEVSKQCYSYRIILMSQRPKLHDTGFITQRIAFRLDWRLLHNAVAIWLSLHFFFVWWNHSDLEVRWTWIWFTSLRIPSRVTAMVRWNPNQKPSFCRKTLFPFCPKTIDLDIEVQGDTASCNWKIKSGFMAIQCHVTAMKTMGFW